MNELWQSFGSAPGLHLPPGFYPVLVQAPAEAPLPPNSVPYLPGLGANVGNVVINLIGAIAILLLGWLIASVVSSIVRSLLKKTSVDNRIASWATGNSGRPTDFNVEGLIASIVFWIIMILALVAFLNVLNLTTVSQPLNNFLNQIFAFLPRLGSAAILAAVAWLVATLAKTVVIRMSHSFGLDERIAGQSDDPLATNSFLLSETLGNALYWFVFLFFLPLILGVLDLQGPLLPVQNLLNEILGALPNIIKAIIIGAIGWLIARVVRGVVTNLLSATGTDRLGSQFGIGQATGGRTLSWLIGTIVYVLILIPTATAALDALQIPAISGPATAMLNQILNSLPLIFTAAAILAIAYVIGKFIADLVSSILSSVGFDNVFYWLGLQSAPYTPRVPPTQYDTEFPTGETIIQDTDVRKSSVRSPSDIAGVVVLVGIMLFATVAATNILNIPALTAIVSGLLLIFGRILVGLVVFAVGLYLANLAYSLITSSGSRQSQILGQTARIAIIGLVTAMALQQMGIAPNIVNLAFGLLLGAIAVAIAISFGLGGRDVASEQLREWLKDFKR
ncbi:mechanosensitive ion channel [Myxacorys almedinensis]|uniref:Mechanosensitive ion channel n=1 Tax=Myxacorys almedinensis A TaxID=2690445 RepID=A0A8J7YZ49_9CYAN|nr:mechanosensitive ion channel [Myxacorys almedinensis]NDJ16030.1 mechanosensitive ion channel [Myxacorys almedinensis A]